MGSLWAVPETLACNGVAILSDLPDQGVRYQEEFVPKAFLRECVVASENG